MKLINFNKMRPEVIDGTKTQTRRVIKFPNGFIGGDIIVKSESQNMWYVQNPRELGVFEIKPRYQVGDICGLQEPYQILRTWYGKQAVEGVY